MLSTVIFDLTYYALAISLILMLAAGTILGLRSRNEDRNDSLGLGLAALGGLITIVETVFLIAISRNASINGFLYQQVQFLIAYVAFAFVLYGTDRGLLSRKFTGANLKRSRIGLWGGYFLTIAASSLFLFNPDTYRITIVGSQEYVAQQLVFWYPLFLALLSGALISFLIVLRSDSRMLRNYAKWLGLFSALVFLGTLRESTIIPSTGDPLTDLFVAFVPFVAGSLCLLMGVRSILRSERSEEQHALQNTPMN